MMTMITRQIPEGVAVEGAVLELVMIITTARVRRTRRAVRQGLVRGRVQRLGRGRDGEGKQGREGGRGRETVKGIVLSNILQEEMISPMLLLCSCRRICMRETPTRRANQSRYI
jgi:hypothetical protein